MPTTQTHPLVRVGGGDRTHILDTNGLTRCENRIEGGPYRTKDADGLYRDPTLVSPRHDAGEGEPTCHWCRHFA